jgi:hypothetical protein
MPSAVGQSCGDMTDCQANTACDMAEHECVTNFPTTLGDDGGATCLVSFDQSGCGFGVGGTGPACRLPGQLRSTGPCCLERNDAGMPASCLDVGTCRREPPGSNSLVPSAGGVCPL